MTLGGSRILILEDEPIVGIALEDMLFDLGAATVLFADRIDEAQTFLAGGGVDLAVLDVNVHGSSSYGVADELISRGIPFIFATGYGDMRHPARFLAVPTIAKPYARNDVLAGLREAQLRAVTRSTDTASADRTASGG